MKSRIIFASMAASLILASAALAADAAREKRGGDKDAPKQKEEKHVSAWASVNEAVAVLHPTQGSQCHGEVRFIQEGEQVRVIAKVEGLTPNQKHAVHVHQYGDCSAPDASSAGSHYNPEGHQHGLVEADQRHAGDLGNLQADANGRAQYEVKVKNISVAGLKNPVIGRGVIVHAKQDDGGQPVGNAGGRIACGVIGVANMEKKK